MKTKMKNIHEPKYQIIDQRECPICEVDQITFHHLLKKIKMKPLSKQIKTKLLHPRAASGL